ncbi:ABC transporter permease [Nocardioides daeguensis]|uniref:ABC transporter permease n=1 Tax=Nocardioides daeguensis TaxID=908359 RepID=UPI001C48ADB8|nr:ABC transporter permease [Nocardioides daeguensis]MBV6728791.1 ABC transporter permease [Nocardioides daeguensis]MCR1773599.1 ABC transporter permease [Nocardioides daeguensis]
MTTSTTSDAELELDDSEETSTSGQGGFGGYSDGTSLVADLGAIASFGLTVARTLPDLRMHSTEVLRQAGIFILKSTLIIWFMMCMLAAEIALEAHYLLAQLGAGGYTAVFSSTGDYTVAPEMWGWILAAKVGCGLVAELGSMRISEEIDALEVMGFDSLVYLVTTRIVAIMIVTPFMFIAGTGLMYMLGYALNVHYFHSVSAGGYLSVFWSFTTQQDLVLSLLVAAIMGLLIVLVGCYYGYNASGGPVGVGKATAKSMVINLVIVSVLGAVFQQLFFGALTRAPISF